MKTIVSKLNVGLLLIALFSLSSAFMAFTDKTDDKGKKSFRVASLRDGKISQKTYKKLIMAYQAQFGKHTRLDAIKMAPGKEGMYLWFVGGNEGSPTFGVELRQVDGHHSIIFGEPLGINNCHKTDSCTSCKVGCGCGRNGGSGSCVEDKTDKMFDKTYGIMKATLTGR